MFKRLYPTIGFGKNTSWGCRRLLVLPACQWYGAHGRSTVSSAHPCTKVAVERCLQVGCLCGRQDDQALSDELGISRRRNWWRAQGGGSRGGSVRWRIRAKTPKTAEPGTKAGGKEASVVLRWEGARVYGGRVGKEGAIVSVYRLLRTEHGARALQISGL